MRKRWIWHPIEKKLVPDDEYVRPQPERSKLAAPMVIADHMKPVQSMLDGQMYDSKSALRSTYKAAGVEEIGNEKSRPLEKPKPDQKAIEETVGKSLAAVGITD